MVSHPSTMMEALRALISCILTCWPRLVKNQQEQGRLLRIIGICWVNMHDGDTVNGPSVDDETELGQELKRTARIVSALQRASETQPPLDMSDILAREPLLSTLFQA